MATVNISYTPDGQSPLGRFAYRRFPVCFEADSYDCAGFPLAGNIVAPGYDNIVYNMGDMAWVITSTALVFIMCVQGPNRYLSVLGHGPRRPVSPEEHLPEPIHSRRSC
jgi:hypothetical protein